MFFKNFSRHINEDNAAQIFQHYGDITPDTSIRLAAIITQASDSDMTVFSMIKRAMNECANFPYWAQAADQFPLDFNNFAAALGIVGGNHFYVFRRNLGHVATNQFKTLGYLSQQLLINCQGDAALDSYQGLRGSIPSKEWIDRIVEHVVEESVHFAFDQPATDAGHHHYQNVRQGLGRF